MCPSQVSEKALEALDLFLFLPLSPASIPPSTSASVETYPIHQVEDQPHRHAKLLKVQVPVIVHVRQVPHLRQLILGELAVLEHRRGLVAGEVRAAVGEGGEDLPVAFDFPLLDLLGGHDVCGGEVRW